MSYGKLDSQQLLLINTQGPDIRKEEEVIEWIRVLLEMNQIMMWSKHHFYFNLSTKKFLSQIRTLDSIRI
jgi:hypothetical protein